LEFVDAFEGDLKAGAGAAVAVVLGEVEGEAIAGDLHVERGGGLEAVLPIDMEARVIEVELAGFLDREDAEDGDDFQGAKGHGNRVAWVGRFWMKSWGGVLAVAGMVGLGAGWAFGQETPQSTTPTPAEKVYEVEADVVAPELVPKDRTINDAEPCKEMSDGVVALSVVVDELGEPRNIAVMDPKITSLDRLALHIVWQDTFKPGTLKGTAVAVKESVEVSIKACVATKTDASGGTTEVLRLTAQPVQTFGGLSVATNAEAHGSVGDEQQRNLGLSRVGNGVSAPVPLNTVEAEFSDEARRRNIEGVCLVSVIVDAQGKPQNARVVRALGAGLDEKAIEAVNKYRFKPAMKDGKTPVPVMITVQVNFRL